MAAIASPAMRTSRPWSAYALRLLCSGLLFASGYVLLAQSTFALRMRNDAPIGLLILVVAAVLSFLPLLFGRRFLAAFLVSGFLLSGIGAYWWTTIPWDEFIRDNGFPAARAPRMLDYALIASPAIVAAFYAAVSRPSLLRADLRNRGADPEEISRASCVSFVSGAALLVFCGALATLLWGLMASGLVFAAIAPIPTGIPALVIVAALVAVAWAIFARRVPRFRVRKATRPTAAAPTPGLAAGAPRRGLIARMRAKSNKTGLG